MLKIDNFSGGLLLVFAPFAWASNIVVGRSLAGIVEPDLLNLMRWSGTALVLFPFVALQFRSTAAAVKRSLPLLLSSGIVGLGLFQTMLYLAVSLTTATHAATALSLSPLVAMIVTRRAGVTAHVIWLGFAVSLVGVIIVQSDALVGTQLDAKLILGDAIALGAALLWGAYNVLAAKLPKDIPPFTSLFVMSIAAMITSSLPVFARGDFHAIKSLTASAWLSVIYLVLVVSVMGLAAYNIGVRSLGAATGGLFIHLTPIFAVVLSFFVLGEHVRLIDGAGFMFVLVGLIIAMRKPMGPANL